MTTFPVCRHAEPPLETAVRRCTSPKLAGLKWVSPATCLQCYCRDHESVELDHDSVALPVVNAHVLPCAYLGSRLQDARLDGGDLARAAQADAAYECAHPNHAATTPEQCRRCHDYLFPLATPRTPRADVRRIIDMPAVDQHEDWWTWDNVQWAHREKISELARSLPATGDWGEGRGIAVVGGGKYFVSAYVTIRMLRHSNCRLPIELWHLDGEIDDELRDVLSPYGVTCCDASERTKTHPFRFLQGNWRRGWQLKAYALRHCSFREVLLLDADSYPVRDPEFLFDWPEYRERGAILWPDLEKNANFIPPYAWPIFGVEKWPELPTESGQMLVDKSLCWREVNLALAYNAQADFVYRILYGDKDTFPLAWHRLGRKYARLWPHCTADRVALRQFDAEGNTLFIHRIHDKFRLPSTTFDGTPQMHFENERQAGFPLEDECFEVLSELAGRQFSSRWLQGDVKHAESTIANSERLGPPDR